MRKAEKIENVRGHSVAGGKYAAHAKYETSLDFLHEDALNQLRGGENAKADINTKKPTATLQTNEKGNEKSRVDNARNKIYS